MWWYRVAIAILVVGEGYLVFSGRLAASYHFMTQAPAAANEAEFGYHFLTNALWIAFLAPLGLTVVWIAHRDKAATAGAAYWRAVKTVFGVAWSGERAQPLDDAIDSVNDDPLAAAMKGLAVAALLPSFFWFGPTWLPHTARTAAWLLLTGVMAGASIYCMERARPFLKASWHEAQRGRLFRRWWSPYPISYDPPGDRWVRWHWLFAILTVLCWLGGGVLAFGAGVNG